MGNTLAGGKKKAKVMKIDGQMLKLKTPTKVSELIKEYPDHVVLESETFKRFGIRAKPLDAEEYLEGGKIYFVVELPKLAETSVGRSVSGGSDGCGSVRVKVRLPKGEVDRLIGESRDEKELSERIVDFYVRKKGVTPDAGGVWRR